MTSPWDKTSKRVVAHEPHLHAPPSGHAGFLAPPPTRRLDVSRLALGVAMARTGSIGHAPGDWLWKRAVLAAAEMADLIDEDSDVFDLLPVLLHINSAERTALAGRIGAGMCDVLMQSLHYVWRDQASTSITASKKPLADFLYARPSDAGLALAEAKGSMRSQGRKATQKLANDAYKRQVEPWLGAVTVAGKVLHGYAVALRAPVEKPAYLCVAETGDPISGGGGGSRSTDVSIGGSGGAPGLDDKQPNKLPSKGRVNASVALGNYATALSLVGHDGSAVMLQSLRVGGLPASDAAAALQRLEPDHRGLIVGRVRGSIAPYTAIRYAVDAAPLRALAQFLASADWAELKREDVELPILPPRLDEEDIVQCPDGLVGIAASREEGLTTEGLLLPEVLGGGAVKLREQPREPLIERIAKVLQQLGPQERRASVFDEVAEEPQGARLLTATKGQYEDEA